MHKRFIALILAVIVVTAVIWLVLSAIVSFVALDWVAITSLPIGRASFAIIWIWAVGWPVLTGKIDWKNLEAK